MGPVHTALMNAACRTRLHEMDGAHALQWLHNPLHIGAVGAASRDARDAGAAIAKADAFPVRWLWVAAAAVVVVVVIDGRRARRPAKRQTRSRV